MKSYKLVNSREVQEKAFRLGCKWNKKVNDVIPQSYFLYIDKNLMMIDSTDDAEYYLSCDYQEITQADFLALPEPIKVGDWVRNGSPKQFGITQVLSIEGNEINKEGNGLVCRFLDIKDCTKLTDEQIEVLGL